MAPHCLLITLYVTRRTQLPIADKEMLSVIRSLEEWRHYLEGANLQFEVWNDHTNLQWFMKRQDLNR